MDWRDTLRRAFERAGHVPDHDVIEELAQRAALAHEQARVEGHTPTAARAAVEAQIAEWVAERGASRRVVRRPPVVDPPPSSASWFVGILQDVRYASRLLVRRPGPAILTVVTMSLGIGATTVLFSVIAGVLLKPLPWPDADRLITIREGREGSTRGVLPFMTNGTYLAWREGSTIEGLAGYSSRPMTITGAGDAQRVRITSATATLFPLLRARPQLGTLFTNADETASNLALISDALWRNRYGGSSDVLGRTIQLNGATHTVVGVMPKDFVFPDAETVAWIPFHVRPVVGNTPDQRFISMFSGIARLRPGVSPQQAAEEATARGREAPDGGLTAVAVFGSRGPVVVTAMPMLEAMTGDVRAALIVFFGAVGLLLATATANVASIHLAQATSRRRELAIRAAIGAGGSRIARQLLVESMLTGLLGCAGGLLLAGRLHQFLPSVLPVDFPRTRDIAIDSSVVAFAVIISLISSLLFGLLPAIHARRLNLVASIAEDGSAPVGGGRTRTGRARALIMAGQVAIAAVLLVGASLLLRSFSALIAVDRGYDVQNILTARLPMSAGAYKPERRAQILDAILARLRGVSGVVHAAATTVLPLTGTDAMLGFEMPPTDGSQRPVAVRAGVRTVSPDYFKALGIRIVEGRGFSDTDTQTSLPVVVVNREFSRQYLGGKAPGRVLPAVFEPDRPEWHVIGEVENILPRNLADAVQPEMFVSTSQYPAGLSGSDPTIVVRTADDPEALASRVRQIVRDEDRSIALDSVMTMEARLMGDLSRPRLFAAVLAGFALFAVSIAGVGLFGVLSYTVAQRRREIGIRSALGARPGDIISLVVKQGASVTLAGLAVGMTAAFILARTVSHLLYGVSTTDRVTFVLVPILLAGVAAAACIVPARRAASVDPVHVLRR